MRAVNLIPRDARRPGMVTTGFSFGPSYAILAVLAIAVALVTVLVLTNNTISDRQAKLDGLRSQLANEQALVGRLVPYQRFAQLAQARVSTVREIVAARFDWHRALSDLSKVVPANTSLQTLNATVSPSAGGGGSAVRGDIPTPAFDLVGCTRSQDDVARLMSRLRLVEGVTRVTLESSAGAGAGVTSGSAATTTSTVCSGGPSFQLVVFFSAPPTLGASTTPSTLGTTR
jgi:Tfp pilus assembly protein PilN